MQRQDFFSVFLWWGHNFYHLNWFRRFGFGVGFCHHVRFLIPLSSPWVRFYESCHQFFLLFMSWRFMTAGKWTCPTLNPGLDWSLPKSVETSIKWTRQIEDDNHRVTLTDVVISWVSRVTIQVFRWLPWRVWNLSITSVKVILRLSDSTHSIHLILSTHSTFSPVLDLGWMLKNWSWESIVEKGELRERGNLL